MAEHLPRFKPGQAITLTAGSGGVTGGLLVEITGDYEVGTAGEGSAAFGVAGFDAPAGDHVTVFRGGVQPLTAAGAISAGDRVIPAADGRVSTTADGGIGVAVEAATAAGDRFDVALDN